MSSYIATSFINLFEQMLPKGRAYNVPDAIVTSAYYTDEDGEIYTDETGEPYTDETAIAINGGIIQRLNIGISGDGTNRIGTLERVYYDANSILDHILPDNDNYTDGTIDPNDNDCNDNERRYGLIQYGITGPNTPTRTERMMAIATKMRYPGSVQPRQAAEYLQSTLQSAGFNLFVYGNLNNQSAAEVLGFSIGDATLNNFDLNQLNLNASYSEDNITLIANSLDESVDAAFVIPGGQYQGTFFIAGATITTFASVPLVRKIELRQMILRLKPQHMAGFLFIDYV